MRGPCISVLWKTGIESHSFHSACSQNHRCFFVFLSFKKSDVQIAIFPILADPNKNNRQSAQLLSGRDVVSGRMDGCRASVLHSCSCRDRPKLGRLEYI